MVQLSPSGSYGAMNLMNERHLIVLRPNQYNRDDLRLALFKDDYRQYVQGRVVQSLYVNLNVVNTIIGNIKTYVNHGSIAEKTIINTWLRENNYIEGTPLLFELLIDDSTKTHIYNYLGTVDEVTSYINTALGKITITASQTDDL